MPKLNWDIVKWNVTEAREQLEKIEQQILANEISEFTLEVEMAHAYHHLNKAWNARRVTSSRYQKCATADFNEWGEFPTDLELMRVED